MNQTDFMKAVAKRNGMSNIQAYRAINAVLDTIRTVLADGQRIQFSEFGTFEVMTDMDGNKIPVFKDGAVLDRVLNTPVNISKQEG